MTENVKVFNTGLHDGVAPRHKKVYTPMEITAIEVGPGAPILAASIVEKSVIKSVGQELGPVYDLSAADGIDVNTGKTFSHEWE